MLMKQNQFLTAVVLVVALAAGARADVHWYLPPDEPFADRRIDPAVLADLKQDARFNEKLSGRNRYTIKVIDARTKKPIPEFVIHAIVNRAGAEKLDLFSDSISHLESNKISDPGGACTYEKLGSLRVEFQVIAKGYAPNFKIAQIFSSGSATIELQPAASVTGRIVDAQTSRPVDGLAVALAFPAERAKKHYTYAAGELSSEYSTRTDADGRFHFENIPADRYQPYLPDLHESLKSVTDDLHNEAMRQKYSRTQFEKERDETLSTNFPIVPSLSALALKERANIDLGMIRLDRAPVVTIEFWSKALGPLPYFPFEIVYFSGSTQLAQQWKSTTGGDGRTTVTLVGWRPGMDVAIYSPEFQPQIYRTKALADRHPDPLEGFSDKSFYEEEYRNSQFNSERWPELYQELKASEQKAKFRKAVEKRRKEIRDEAARLAALPEHPACAMITPKAGGKFSVRIDCKPTTAQLDLHFVFRDKTTSAPIGRVSGIVSTGSGSGLRPQFLYQGGFESTLHAGLDGWRIFRSSDPSGRVELPALTLEDNVLQASSERQACLMLFAEAPGYARQMFELPLAMIRSGKPLAFELEPEARVRGRVVMADTGQPPTSQTLLALSRRLDPSQSVSHLNIAVFLANESIEAQLGRPDALPHFNVYGQTQVGRDGRFEIGGIRARDGWWLKLAAGFAMPTYARKLALKPGDNDIGEIRIGEVGALAGRITDETGAAVPGAKFELPLGGVYRDDATDTTGTYRLSLLKIDTGRQLVRIAPPWGNTAARFDLPCTSTLFDSIRTLDMLTTNTLNALLDRGHALELTIENPRRIAEIGADNLARAVSPEFVRRRGHASEPAPYFAFHGVQVQALAANADGFTFSQERVFGSKGLSTSTTTIRLANIPPGRHAVVLNGAVFAMGNFTPSKHSAVQIRPMTSFPLAYAEFEMPAADSRVTLKPSLADIRVTMSTAPPAVQDPPFVLIDREQPQSTAFGSFHRRICVPRQTVIPTDPERQLTPVIGYASGCFEWNQNAGFDYRPGRLIGVPPGKYRVEAYFDMWDIKADAPYFTGSINVPEQGNVELNFPYQQRKPREAAMPMQGN